MGKLEHGCGVVVASFSFDTFRNWSFRHFGSYLRCLCVACVCALSRSNQIWGLKASEAEKGVVMAVQDFKRERSDCVSPCGICVATKITICLCWTLGVGCTCIGAFTSTKSLSVWWLWSCILITQLGSVQNRCGHHRQKMCELFAVS